MNKKSQALIEFLMTYGWAILAAMVVLISLFTMHSYFLPSPKFQIYEEVCEKDWITNQTEIDKREYLTEQIHKLYDDWFDIDCNVIERHGLLNQSEICLKIDRDISELIDQKYNLWGIYKGEVCEKVEVYEIKPYSLLEEDLTIEWLNGYCKCFDYGYGNANAYWDCPNISSKVVTNNRFGSPSTKRCIFDRWIGNIENGNIKDCISYKCGNYIVEVEH